MTCDGKAQTASRPIDAAPQHARDGRGAACCVVSEDACRHVALIDVSSYPVDTEVPSFGRRVVCAKCGSRGTRSTCGRNGSIHVIRSRSLIIAFDIQGVTTAFRFCLAA
jgi:hypothetical protein